MPLIADLFVTTTNRADLLRSSLESLRACTPRDQFRLTVVRDGNYGVSQAVLEDFLDTIDHVLVHSETLGLGPSINQALAHIDALNRWFEDPRATDQSQVAPFICYCQDDILFQTEWLEKLAKRFLLFEKQHRLGFATGIECVEHSVHQQLGGNMVLKKWIRAAQMFGRREYWMSMFPIPRFDPETGGIRARPDHGIGSGVDWHFIRNHPNSVDRSGRNCLVLPGLCLHAGYRDSTWLKRELPESEEDKEHIARFLDG